jgi:hypothetical protein
MTLDELREARDGGNAEAAAKFDDLEKRKEALKVWVF